MRGHLNVKLSYLDRSSMFVHVRIFFLQKSKIMCLYGRKNWFTKLWNRMFYDYTKRYL